MEQESLKEFTLSCDDPQYTFTVKIQISLPNDAGKEQIEHELFDCIKDIVCEQSCFEELVFNAIDSYSPPTHGYYNLPKLIEEMYDTANKYIERKTKGIIVNARLYTGDDLERDKSMMFGYSLLEILEGVIDDRYISEQSSCDAGSKIESSLLYFEKKSSWRYGFIVGDSIVLERSQWPTPLRCNPDVKWLKDECEYNPIIWFGLPGERPLPRWSLSRNMTDDDLAFWFKNDGYEQMEMLGQGIDDIFLIWYFAECGNVMPDIEEIRNNCPVKLAENMTMPELVEKINDFFLNLT